MKKAGIICLSAAAVFLSLYFCGCGDSHVSEELSGSSAPYEPAADEPDRDDDLPEGFTVTFDRGTDIGYRVSETENGTMVYFEGNILEDTSYTISGNLNGGIYVDADRSNSHEFGIIFREAVIRSDSIVPLYCLSCGGLSISAADGTDNYIYDGRMKSDDESGISACVYSTTDISLLGEGRLLIKSENNNGVHSKRNLSVSGGELYIECSDNALKGNDGVRINSGRITLSASEGDGIKTSDSDISKSGVQNGNISIIPTENTFIDIYATGDGMDSAYGVEVYDNGYDLELDIHTERYSSTSGIGGFGSLRNRLAGVVSAGMSHRLWGGGWGWFDGNTDKGDYSAKGIKSDSHILISGGHIGIKSYDDCIHASSGVKLENGEKSKGDITISGGSVSLFSHDDAVHADGTLIVTGGNIDIESCYEGMEANHIDISGGNIRMYAKDDGLNVTSNFSETPDITVSGGVIDITMGKGDVDGIDSNGSYTQTGGTVISRGSPGSANPMASGLDTDRKTEITGGTLVLIGGLESVPDKGKGVYQLNYGTTGREGGFGRMGGGTNGSVKSVSLDAGIWMIGDTGITFELSSRYSGCTVFSDLIGAGETYVLTDGNTEYSASAS